MKRILIDLYKTQNPYSGLGQFSINFGKQLCNQVPLEYSLNFLVPNQPTNLYSNHSNFRFVKTTFQKRYFPYFNKKYDLWHSLHQFPSYLPRKNTKWILTIHDLNFLIIKKGIKKQRYLQKLQQNVNKADVITAISNFTKNEIENKLELKGKKIRVIYNGVNESDSDTKTPLSSIKKDKFFLSIGIFNPKKNFKTLLPLMKYFEDYKLILVGDNNTKYGKEIIKEIIKLQLQNKVILTGKVEEPIKLWLLDHCSAFLFPSIAEGFGMPPIEAMKAGKPVFLSQHTSLPEIGGEMAFYFQNFEEKQMASLIKEKLSFVNKDPEKFSLKSKNYASRFSWNHSIQQYLKLYKEITI